MEKLPDTIEECHSLISLLLETTGKLTQRIERLESENATLKEHLATNSQNSSLPPSRDRAKKKAGKKSQVPSLWAGKWAIRVIIESYYR